MPLILLLALRLLSAGAASQTLLPEAPPAYRSVLERRALDVAALRALGFVFVEDLCYHLGADGLAQNPPLTPEQLAPLLPAPRAKAPSAEPMAALGVMTLPLSGSGLPPDSLFDGRRALAALSLQPRSAASAADATVKVAALAVPPGEPWLEPPFDASWAATEKDFRDPKRRARALQALAARFQKDEDAEGSLSEGAPEALRLLARELHDGRGGPAAAGELRRELALVSSLEPDEKAAFSRRVRSPLTVYEALSRSHAPHALDSRLYFKRLEELLAARGLSLPDFIAQEDPSGAGATSFLLRCHAYDLLIPRLNAHPAEASALAAWLFPEGDGKTVRERASQLEGLMTQLAVQGRRSGALDAFVSGLEAREAAVSPPAARRIAAYLKLNEPLLPRSWRARVERAAAILPPGLLEAEGLAPDEPYDLWPTDRWTFALHFASTDGYKAFLVNFQARGWRIEPGRGDGTGVLVKDFDGLEVRMTARLHPGDKDGFLRGATAAEYLKEVRRDLRDPAIQGVILRNHAQFRVANLFDRRVTKGKLLLDGSCRSAWDVQTLRRACPTCSFIVNTGTGFGSVNNQAVAAIVEGLGRREEWSDIGAEWARYSPKSSARIQGPWTPPYEQALRALDAADKSAAGAAGR